MTDEGGLDCSVHRPCSRPTRNDLTPVRCSPPCNNCRLRVPVNRAFLPENTYGHGADPAQAVRTPCTAQGIILARSLLRPRQVFVAAKSGCTARGRDRCRTARAVPPVRTTSSANEQLIGTDGPAELSSKMAGGVRCTARERTSV